MVDYLLYWFVGLHHCGSIRISVQLSRDPIAEIHCGFFQALQNSQYELRDSIFSTALEGFSVLPVGFEDIMFSLKHIQTKITYSSQCSEAIISTLTHTLMLHKHSTRDLA